MSSDFVSPVPLPPDIAEALARLRPGAEVVYFPSVSSTNDVAARLAERGAPDLTAVVAEQQTAGRGRLGRTWFSPPGAGLYVSLVLRPSGASSTAAVAPCTRDIAPGTLSGFVESPVSLVPLAAAVAFTEGVRACTHLPVCIKWPNDLVVDRRKLAGILTEAAGTACEHLVIGFGLNLRSAAYPPEIADRATSIETELGRPIDRGAVLAQCLAAMAHWMDALRAGKAAAVLERWRALAPSARGAAVEFAGAAAPVRGVTDGIDDAGALLVRTSDGVERIIAGEVKWL